MTTDLKCLRCGRDGHMVEDCKVPVLPDGRALKAEPPTQQAQAEAVPQWVSCRCFDDVSKRLCADKNRCLKVEAFAAAPQPKEQSK